MNWPHAPPSTTLPDKRMCAGPASLRRSGTGGIAYSITLAFSKFARGRRDMFVDTGSNPSLRGEEPSSDRSVEVPSVNNSQCPGVQVGAVARSA